jgi:hypothetical protein
MAAAGEGIGAITGLTRRLASHPPISLALPPAGWKDLFCCSTCYNKIWHRLSHMTQRIMRDFTVRRKATA